MFKFYRETFMFKKALIFNLLFFLILVPVNVSAQQNNIEISADKITVNSANILFATGNVTVSGQGLYIAAREMLIDRKRDQISFKGITEFNDGKSTKIMAEKGVLSDDMSTGLISAAKIVIDESIKIEANKVEIQNGTLSSAYNINRITSCEDCKKGKPLWHFSASSAKRDNKNQNIVYRNVVLRVLGTPVGYMPYLRVPDPSVERAWGFLTPGLKISSNLGTGLKLPFFIPIGRSKDLLLTPFLSPKTKTLEFRYRQKLINGDLSIDGALSSDEITFGKNQYFYNVRSKIKLKYGVELDVKSGSVSNSHYLDDYSYGSLEDLNTTIKLNKSVFNKDRLFKGELSYVRNKERVASLSEYYSVDFDYSKKFDQRFLPGNLIFDIYGRSALNLNDKKQIARPPSSVHSGLNYSNQRNIGPLVVNNLSFIRLNSFVNSQNIKSLNDEFSTQYGVSSKFSFPLIKRHTDNTQTLTPSIMISANGQSDRIKGSYFRGVEQLSFGNIYASKKYVSLSESEKDFSLSAGVDYSIAWENHKKLDLSFAGVQIGNATYNPSEKNGLSANKLNFLSSFRHKNTNLGLSSSGQILFSDAAKILNSNFQTDFRKNNIGLYGRYEYVDLVTDNRLSDIIENIEFSSSYRLSENIGLNLLGRYDLSEKSMAKSSYGLDLSQGKWDYQFVHSLIKKKSDNLTLSATYDDQCTRVKISIESKSPLLSTDSKIQSLAVKIYLKPFTSFSVMGN